MNYTKEKEAAEFILELQKYTREGVTLWVNDKSSSPVQAAQECLLRDETCYMRDYIRDDSDRITQIRFDRVDPVPEGYHGGTNFSGNR